MAMKTVSDAYVALRGEVHEIRVEMHRAIDLLTRQVADQRETLLLLGRMAANAEEMASGPVVSAAAAASTSPRSSTPLSHVQSVTQLHDGWSSTPLSRAADEWTWSYDGGWVFTQPQ